jgi:uncharacterized membrane-anchored protein
MMIAIVVVFLPISLPDDLFPVPGIVEVMPGKVAIALQWRGSVPGAK